jgi:hypothetical protein
MVQWVVDTWVLEKCGEAHDPASLKALQLLSRILEKDMLCLDLEGDILKEYLPHMKPRTHVATWWAEMRKQNSKWAFHSQKLPNAFEQNLVHRLSFDPADLKFVGVAHKTHDHLIASEDSDYSSNICNYLYNVMSIRVICLADACNLPS